MDRDDELIEDSELSVRLDPEKHLAYHLSDVPDPRASIDQLPVEEIWQQVRASDGRLELVGAGGFGQVYKEKCTHDVRGIKVGRCRAVKVIQKPDQDGAQKKDQKGVQKAFYREELKALAKFSQPRYHNWFVKSFGWYTSGDRICITMEYLQHGDLQRYLSKPFSEDDTRRIASQVVRGIGFMHKYNFIHRDLKPANLLVVDKPPEKDWRVKISDFGISKRAADGVDRYSTANIGTLEYMAPEVRFFRSTLTMQKAQYTRAADMWAIGAICVHLLTGNPAFHETDLVDYYHHQGPFTPDDALSSHGTSEDGRAFVQKLMARDPKHRLTAEQAVKYHWITDGPRVRPGGPYQPVPPSFPPSRLQPASYPEPKNEYNATAQWDSTVGDRELSGIDAIIRPAVPVRRVSSPATVTDSAIDTAIHNPGNQPPITPVSGDNTSSSAYRIQFSGKNVGRSNDSAGDRPAEPQSRYTPGNIHAQQVYFDAGALDATPSVQPTIAAFNASSARIPNQVLERPRPLNPSRPQPAQRKQVNSDTPAKKAKPKPPATPRARMESFKDLERQQYELFRNAGPSLSKKERKKQRQEQSLPDDEAWLASSVPPSPPQPDVVKTTGLPGKAQGVDLREDVEVIKNPVPVGKNTHAQRAREAKEMEQVQRELFLNAGPKKPKKQKRPKSSLEKPREEVVDNGRNAIGNGSNAVDNGRGSWWRRWR